MKFNKTIWICLLSLVLLLTSSALSVTAADAKKDEEPINYLKEVYATPEDKLDTMTLYLENDDYAIYGLEVTGEVAILVKESGQILFTNPYDAAASKSSDAVKQQLMSQIILTYTDSTGAIVSFNSYADAAFASEETKQIHMNPTRNGLRVEYTIGREAVKYIVPRQIEKNAFEQDILSYFDPESREYKKLAAYYILKDPSTPGLSAASVSAMKTRWPITEKFAIYILDTAISNREMLELEGYIKNNTYYNEYAKVEEMYELLNYVDTSAAPALFRFAIEYSLDEYGIKINMPGSSVRYDSSNYTLKSVKFLPYFGAGTTENSGFTFVPDGSGTITRFEDIGDKAFTLSGKLYGRDYSFHVLSGTTQETMRFPAFGLMQKRPLYADGVAAEIITETTDEEVNEESAEETDETQEEKAEDEEEEAKAPVSVSAKPAGKAAEPVISGYVNEGFVAYMEEGDAMAEISADHGGTVHKFSSVYTTFYPKPSDSYELEGISSSGNAQWTVSSDRRYIGNYTLRVFPITGDDADYSDMAEKVREYLLDTGVLAKNEPKDDTSDDVPLYIETFGTLSSSQKVAGFPVTMQMPLTTFDQVKEMTEDLASEGITNINYRLIGWYNGGLRHSSPSKLKVEGKLGGEKGLKELTAYAAEKGIGVYPDLDFVYVSAVKNFDGFDFKKDTAKTIDDRSAVYRKYSPLYQGFEERGKLIIAPKSMLKFYDGIREKYASFGASGLSVGTLGSELSSDHNPDYTLNREDTKTIVSGLLADMKADTGSIMVEGGNAYALAYADHVLNVPLDSSQNINTSLSVPFVGMVLHGNVHFTGSAINLDGDFEYSFLKAMENGADLYFILSKENTDLLKQYDDFSKYYAIGYDIWRDANENDLVSTYKRFNDAMKRVKYAYLTEHEQLAERVIRVKYDNDVEFVLNYNTHPVEVDGVEVAPLDFVQR